MATSFVPLSVSVGGSHLKSSDLFLGKRNSSLFLGPKLAVQRKSNIASRRNLASPLRAEYRDDGRIGGGEFVAGFLLGGAIFGAVAYTFAPQIRRTLLNEDEHGFMRGRRPRYYDEELEPKEALLEKVGQINAAIDNISSRLRGNNKKVPAAAPRRTDPEYDGI
ncbi:uncharacterized protein LOC131652048 [Vicia villosa]|uniref:uncharacterized protein LOC131652048 n=1 Tax=Vicia villosa TaxID=3911 RepID=UPI00273C206E|nr:uncharacterized protein LOC131652048 [Vicia villosa]